MIAGAVLASWPKLLLRRQCRPVLKTVIIQGGDLAFLHHMQQPISTLTTAYMDIHNLLL